MHPTEEELSDYAYATHPKLDSETARHVATCEVCRTAVDDMARAISALRNTMTTALANTGAEHIDDDTLIAYVHGTLTPEVRERVEAHKRECSSCRRAVLSYRAHRAHHALEPSRGPSRPALRWHIPFALAASVALAATVISLLYEFPASQISSIIDMKVAGLDTQERIVANGLPVVTETHPASSATTGGAAPTVGSSGTIAAIEPANIVAVVIGNYDYTHEGVPDAPHAQNDLREFSALMTGKFGAPAGNVLKFENTTSARLNEIFGTAEKPDGLLSRRITPNETDLFVYYSGHGVPDIKTKRPYLLPTDADPHLASLSGYSLDQMYRNLGHLPARSITVILETNFTGHSVNGPLHRNVSPALIAAKNPAPADSRFTVFMSGTAGQINTLDRQNQLGLFTLTFIHGATGQADVNRDGRVTVGEMDSYVRIGVATESIRSTHGSEQQPEVFRTRDRFLNTTNE
jgi:anti-sigma factor RsiW